MRAPLIAIALFSLSDAVCAQPANGTATGLESCFQLARAAAAICYDPTNSAVERYDCQKTRAALGECLEHTARSAPSETPAGTGSSKMPSGTVSPELPTSAISPDTSTGSVAPNSPDRIVPLEKPSATVSPDNPTGTVSPARAVDIPSKPSDTNWVVSETTSPVDYTPLITASFHLPFNVKDAPNTFAIRCRGLHTELQVRTEGTWHASRAGEVQVAYQINDQPLVKLPWTASADGKTANYKGEAVGLLQSLPEGARLKINVFDGPGPSHEATFQLAGLDAVREKIAMTCKWAPTANKMSSGKR
jgi:hypothetical protein